MPAKAELAFTITACAFTLALLWVVSGSVLLLLLAATGATGLVLRQLR